MKYRQAALSDGLLLIAHVSSARAQCRWRIYIDGSSPQILYVSHWLVLLFALINCLGKSEAITDALTKAKAAKVSPYISPKSLELSDLLMVFFVPAGLCQSDIVCGHSEREHIIHHVPYPRDLHQRRYKMVVPSDRPDSTRSSHGWISPTLSRMFAVP